MPKKKYHVETSKDAHKVIRNTVKRRNAGRMAGDPRHTFESVSHEIVMDWSGRGNE